MRRITIVKQAALAVSAGLFVTACSSTKETHETSYSSGAAVSESSGAQASYSTSGQAISQNEVNIPLHEEQLSVSKRSVPAGQVTIRKIVTTETVNQPVELRHEKVIIERQGSGASTTSSSTYGSSSQSSQSSGAGVSAQANLGTSGAGASVNTGEKANADVNANAQAEPAGAAASVSTDTSKTENAKAEDQSSSNLNEPAGASAPAASTSSTSTSSSTRSDTSGGPLFQEQTYTIQLYDEEPLIQKNIVEKGRVMAHKQSTTESRQVSDQVRREDVKLDQGAGKNVELRGDFNTGFSESSGAQQQGSTSYNTQSRTSTQYSTGTEYRQPAAATSVQTYSTFDNAQPVVTRPIEDRSLENKTRGGAEGLTNYGERQREQRVYTEPSGAEIRHESESKSVEVHTP